MWKTKLVRKVMTVQNCSMKKLPKRLVAWTPGRKSFVLFELSNVCELLVMVFHADSTNATVVVCDNGACRTVEPSIAQQAATTEPTAPTVAAEPADPAPVTLAQH
jgi:hypothetical protein